MIILKSTHLPTGEVEQFGPWEDDDDLARKVSFMQGFICGKHYGRDPQNYDPKTIKFEVEECENADA